MKQTTILFMIVGFLLVCGLVFIYVMAELVKENSYCVADPFTYAASQVVDRSGNFKSTMCTCSDGMGSFYFDNNSVYQDNPLIIEKPYVPSGNDQKFNYSSILSS